MAISIIFPVDTDALNGEQASGTPGLSSFADGSPVDAIKQNLKMLLLTIQGERVMDKDFGVGIQQYLFESRSVVNFSAIEQQIRQQVAAYMPYVTLDEVSVMEGGDETVMRVVIKFFYNGLQTPEVFELEVI